jgi:Ring finger domain
MLAHDRRQVDISSIYVGDNDTQNANVGVSIILPLVAIFGGLLLLIAAILVATRLRGTSNQTPPRSPPPSRTRQTTLKGTLQVLSITSLGSIPITKFNMCNHARCWVDKVSESGLIKDEATAQAITNDTAAEQRSVSCSNSVAASQSPDHVNSAHSGAIATNQPRYHRLSCKSTNINCSICDEEFQSGDDVRLLPCYHGYHPTCVDPWLLERSVTCPLWYNPPLHKFETHGLTLITI